MLVSDFVASSSARRIKRLYEASGNRIGIETWKPHGLTDEPVYCRVGGFDGLYDRAHRANNWTGTGPVYGLARNGVTGLPDVNGYAWGGDPWENYEVIDSRNIALDDAIWKLNSGDYDPVFRHGVLYQSLVDASPAIVAALDFVRDDESWLIKLGPGIFASLTATAGTVAEMADNGTFIGSGQNATMWFAGDFLNAQLMTNFAENNEIGEITLYGNRAFQGAGRHLMRIGGEDQTLPVKHVRLFNMAARDSSGYFINVGKKAPKVHFEIDNVDFDLSNNDGFDIKNGSNLNYENRATDLFINYHGHGDVGSNRTLTYELAADPVSTTSGSKEIVVTLPVKLKVNSVAILSGLSTVAGIDPNGPLRCTARSGYNCTFMTTGDDANATTTGGGSAGELRGYWKLANKPGFDVRGPGWNLTNITVRGPLDQCTGGRFRGGTGMNNNGKGAHYSTATGIVIEDTTPYPTSNMKGLTVVADKVSISAVTIKGIGGSDMTLQSSFGLYVNASVNGGEINGVVVDGVGTGILNQADRVKFEGSVDGCNYNFYSDGASTTTNGELDADPFNVTAGSSIVTVTFPDAHGFSLSTDIEFDGAEIGAQGIDMNGSFTIASIPTSTTLTVDCGTEALVDGPFGGESVSFAGNPVAHTATNWSANIKSTNATTAHFYLTTRNNAAKIANSDTAGGAGTPITDNGTGTIIGPGNSGTLPNLQRIISLPTSGAGTDMVESDSDTLSLLPSNASGIVTVNLPAPSSLKPGWTACFACNAGSGTVGLALTTPSGTIVDGSASPQDTITSSTTGATLTIARRASSGYIVLSKIGTWTLS